ncbi:unnamed protein product [Porites evermanni]|uniref:Uncharacterized protein n=1 Tax=Porites evermanni TaxID=104178 RepID=A0ABN8SML1_9CNID|nr:unnamed protein product [Porites evermanni]
MDSTLSGPGKLKADLTRATSSGSQPKKLPVEEQSYVVMVTDTAKRSLLTKEILDFCGVLPIYNTKLYPDTSTKTGVAVVTGRRLVKRQVQRTETTTFVGFNRTCRSMVDDKGQLRYDGLDNCRGPNDKWVANCKFKEGLCFYFVKCNYLSGLRYYWNCTEVHKSSAIPVCCDLACADR